MEHNGINIEKGVVGLGLMGCSIVANLLIAGKNVVALAPLPIDLERAPARIKHYLEEAYLHGFSSFTPEQNMERLILTTDYNFLKDCGIVMECVVENLQVKADVFKKIEAVIAENAILTSNTSAIPITILKDYVSKPQRFIGMHFAEPAFTTKFLEIICSTETTEEVASFAYKIATSWGKEPTLVRKDIRGFITNRIMYAMYREAFFLVENGYATVEDVDRSCRNDGGQWMPFCGLFRYMDLTGLQAYYAVMKDLFPTLSNQATVPELIERIAVNGGNGIANGKGFYTYSAAEAEEWEKAYEEFAFEISRLTAKYPIDLIEKRLLEKKLAELVENK
jgi:3-hydroxybutyryl-CoA dehydrogenase